MGLTPFFSAKIFRDLDIKYFLHLQLYCCTISKWQTPIFRSFSLVMIFLKKWVKISYILGHLAFFKNHNYANSQNKQTNIEPLSWMIWVFTSDDRLVTFFYFSSKSKIGRKRAEIRFSVEDLFFINFHNKLVLKD